MIVTSAMARNYTKVLLDSDTEHFRLSNCAAFVSELWPKRSRKENSRVSLFSSSVEIENRALVAGGGSREGRPVANRRICTKAWQARHVASSSRPHIVTLNCRLPRREAVLPSRLHWTQLSSWHPLSPLSKEKRYPLHLLLPPPCPSDSHPAPQIRPLVRPRPIHRRNLPPKRPPSHAPIHRRPDRARMAANLQLSQGPRAVCEACG